MSNFQNTFETRRLSFISDFPICMTIPLSIKRNKIKDQIINEDKYANKKYTKEVITTKHKQMFI